MIAAAMLADGPVTLENVPGIEDVENMFKCAECFGAKISRDIAARTATIDATRLRTARLAPELASKIRTSVLFAGPLLARMGSVSLPPPGGDGIGHRRLDTHFAGFASLGAKVKAGRRILSVKAPKGLSGAKMLLDEASVTATENILMAAVLARGETEIYNAACEPHVQDLCAMLNSMGAKIEGAGTNRIRVEGVEALHGTTARVGCDYIEGASYLTAAAITGGEITLTEIDPEVFAVLEKTFARFEVKCTCPRASAGARWRTTLATRFRALRMVHGPCSLRISYRSSSCSPRRRAARASSSRRCSRAVCTLWTT